MPLMLAFTILKTDPPSLLIIVFMIMILIIINIVSQVILSITVVSGILMKMILVMFDNDGMDVIGFYP